MWNESHNANALTHTKYRSGIAEFTSETIEFGHGQRKCKVLEIICKISCFDKNVEEDINHFLRVVNEGNHLNAIGNTIGGLTFFPNAFRFYQDDTLTYSLYALLMFQYYLCMHPQQYSELIEYTVLVSLLRIQRIQIFGSDTFNKTANATFSTLFVISTALHIYGLTNAETIAAAYIVKEVGATAVTAETTASVASSLIIIESVALGLGIANFLGRVAKVYKQKYNVPACVSILQSIIALTFDHESPKFHDRVHELRCNSDFHWFIDKIPTVIDPVTDDEKKAANEKKLAHIKSVQLKLLDCV